MIDGGNSWLFDEGDPDQAETEEAVFYLRVVQLMEKARNLLRIAGTTCTEGKTPLDGAFRLTNTLPSLLLELMIENERLARTDWAARERQSFDALPSDDEEATH